MHHELMHKISHTSNIHPLQSCNHNLSSVCTSLARCQKIKSSQQVAAELKDEDPVGVRVPPVRDDSLRNSYYI